MNRLQTTAALLIMAVLPLAGPLTHAQGVPPAASKAPSTKAHVLTRAELEQLLAQPDKVLIIDVRRPDEITSVGGFPVYLNIQIGDLENRIAWIPKGRTLVTVSNHAARAGKAADFLASKGFTVAGAAGAQTFEKDGGQLTHIAPAPAEGADAKKGTRPN